MKKVFLALAVVTVALVACNNEGETKKEEVKTETTTPATPDTAAKAPVTTPDTAAKAPVTTPDTAAKK